MRRHILAIRLPRTLPIDPMSAYSTTINAGTVVYVTAAEENLQRSETGIVVANEAVHGPTQRPLQSLALVTASRLFRLPD